jgi:hypothetical protein
LKLVRFRYRQARARFRRDLKRVPFMRSHSSRFRGIVSTCSQSQSTSVTTVSQKAFTIGSRSPITARFLELDRATMSAATLASRLGRYGRLHRVPGKPEDPMEDAGLAWERSYPVFPAVIVALSGAGREALGRRRETVLALLAEEPELQDAPEVEVSMCLLDDLVGSGPFAPIFRRRRDPDADVDWLGERL